MQPTVYDLAFSSAPHGGLLETLTCVAHQANQPAKQLDGTRKKEAYRIKSWALSALIVLGVAVANGVNADGTIAFDIRVGQGSRLHCRPRDLQPDAHAIASRQADSVPVRGPLSERLQTGQAEALKRVCRETSGFPTSEEK